MRRRYGGMRVWLLVVIVGSALAVRPAWGLLPAFRMSGARYVDATVAQSGDGLSWATAWKTISEAAAASLPPGTVVHIRPGMYRETVVPSVGGTAAAPIVYRAEEGPGTVFIVGSETAGTLGETWQPLDVYTGTLPLQPGVDVGAVRYIEADWVWEQAWDAGYGTRFPIETDLVAQVVVTGGLPVSMTRLTPAREPDWVATDPDRAHATWWTADGGAANLDAVSPGGSNMYLMDTADDGARDLDGDGQPDFPGIPPGNVRAIFVTDDDFADPRAAAYSGDAVRQAPLAATVTFNDGRTGHYTHRFLVDAYNADTGVVGVINPLDEGPDGEGHQFTNRTKFYVEGAPRALDCPGEWVHHDGRIFVLTGDATAAGCGLSLSPNDLTTLEIARRFTLLHVEDVSHLRFEDLAFAFNNYARYGYDYESDGDPYPAYLNYPPGAIQISSETAAVKDVVFDGITVEHAVTGLYMGYPAAPSSIAVRDSAFRHIDGTAMQLQAPDNGGLEGIVVERNHFEDLGFRPQIGEGTGLSFSRIGDFVFRDNTVTDVGHNGVQIHQGWGDYIGRNILVASNTFDGACRMAYDCAGLKFHGGGKAYENVLAMRNVARNQRAWSYAAWMMELPYRQSEPGGWWPHTPLGELGMGIYMDYASGVTLYRNLVLDNSAAGIYYTGTYREEQPNLILHNTIVRTLDGIHFGNSHNSVAHTDSRVLGNIFAGVENAGVHLSYSAGDDYQESTGDLSAQNVILDRNVYKLYASPPVTDAWYGYDSAWFDPADLEYLTAGNRWVPYYNVATLHVRTPWEVNGVDGQAGEALFVAEGGALPADYALSSESLALDVGGEALPTELIQLLTDLERDLDVVITDDRRVGSRYDAGAFEHRLANTSLYLPLVARY